MKKVNGWKIAFIITLLLLVVSNGILMYLLLDAGVTYTYMQVGYGDTLKANGTLKSLIPELTDNMTRKDIVHLLRKNNPDAFITDNDEGVGINQLKLQFENDRLINIE